MTEPIKISPEALRQAAAGHTEAADYLRTVPSSNAAIQNALDSLGPVYAELREEGRAKLDERRRSYESQAADHENVAANLTEAHNKWDTHEQEAAQAFRRLTGES
ncbi:MAG: type VII secretion target [Mycolicibacterium sp.]|uniref:type VII secretion target n=1 Tax=Mycolicibacterium sp. TaxID=2320850 RepID=UPI003D0D7C59